MKNQSEDKEVFDIREVELSVMLGVTQFETIGDWDHFRYVLSASVSPATMRCLKASAEHLTESRKDYHIVMKFLDNLEKVTRDVAEESAQPIKLMEE